MKTSSRILLALLAAAALAGCAPKASNTITMATEATFPPYEFIDHGEIVGIDVSICQAIAAELGRELAIVDQKFDSVIPSLVAGRADLAAAGITVTEDRKQSVDFSIPYVTTGIAVIRKTGDESISSPESIKGKRVGVQSGTTSDTYLVDEMKQEPERFDSPASAVAALKAGRVDAVVADIDPATAITKNDKDVEMIGEPLSREDYAVAVRKGNEELLAVVNRVIERIKADGTYDKYRAEAQARFDALNAEAIGADVAGAAGAVAEKAQAAAAEAAEKAQAAAADVAGKAQAAAEDAAAKVQELGEKAADALASASESTKEKAAAAAEKAGDALKAFAADASDKAGEAKEAAGEALANALEAAQGFADDAGGKAAEAVESAKAALSNILPPAPEAAE